MDKVKPSESLSQWRYLVNERRQVKTYRLLSDRLDDDDCNVDFSDKSTLAFQDEQRVVRGGGGRGGGGAQGAESSLSSHRRIQSMTTSHDDHEGVNDDDEEEEANATHNNDEVDPFDCSDLTIPPTQNLVDGVLQSGIEQWKDLDARRVVTTSYDADGVDGSSGGCDVGCGGRTTGREERVDFDRIGKNASRKRKRGMHEKQTGKEEGGGESTLSGEKQKDYEESDGLSFLEDDAQGEGDDNDDETQRTRMRLRKHHEPPQFGWHANRLRLPHGFDYASRRRRPPSPPSESASLRTRSEVVSLTNPNERLDYETELWHLFHSIPTEDEIEDNAVCGAICQHSIQLKKEIEEGSKINGRLDGHGLSRLRMRERHHLPRMMTASVAAPVVPLLKPTHRGRGGGHLLGTKLSDMKRALSGGPTSTKHIPSELDGVIIRIECWRKQLRRGSSPDSNKLEMDFEGSQTLLDVHNAIVQMADDELLTAACMSKEDNAAALSSSGMFFIEDTFYTTGHIVDYATPIRVWLDGPDAQEGSSADTMEGQSRGAVTPTPQKKKSKSKRSVHPPRREYLGIPHNVPLRVVSMSTTRLDSLSIRLGVRYYHVHNGDVESSVFFTDIRARLKHEAVSPNSYPLFHDVWTPSYSTVDCEGCEHRPAVVMTYRDELTNGGPTTALCEGCYYLLHYTATNDTTNEPPALRYNNFEVYSVGLVKDQKDLSVGHEAADAPF